MAEKLTKTEDENQGIVSNEPRSWWHPFENLRHEIDRVFDDFNRGGWLSPFGRKSFGHEPFWRHELSWGASPAVDIVEKDAAFEIEVELPGMDEKDIEVSLADDMLTIRGEKTEEKEEKKKNYCLSERHYGSFQRVFRVPPGVDRDKIEATCSKGVLRLSLPKSAEAQKKAKKLTIKAT
ncbi:MAG: hypothetical protein AMXMBFR6_20710 [Betaproteobacteria bacterium]|nr:hypothetical protein [Rhodocyclaceae bacterium]